MGVDDNPDMGSGGPWLCYPSSTYGFCSCLSAATATSTLKPAGCLSAAKAALPLKPALESSKSQRGGWRAIPYVLLNELAERLASSGLSLNLISYLMGSYHMNQVTAASVISIVSGTASLTPLVGAFVSDAYLGRFWTIVAGSFSNLIATLLLVASAACKSLRPPPGGTSASQGELAFLFGALGLTTVAAGGLRPCSYAFGTDQLINQETRTHDKQQTQSFFNWYFFFLYCSLLAGASILVYVQDKVGWVWGFSLPAACIVVAIALLFLGVPRFRFVPPTGSPFTVYARVLVAALYKSKQCRPTEAHKLFIGTSAEQGKPDQEALPHTERLKWLDHAAILTESDFNNDGSVNSINTFRLCSVNEVEQLKALVTVAPIWFVNFLSTTVLSEHGAFNIPQAKRMNRHVGSSGFSIPPASMSVFSSLTLILWMPLYDRVVVPRARRITGHPGGITTLQRIGVGFLLSVVALVVSGMIEMWRRSLGQHDKKMSAMWLVPQQSLFGMAESLHAVGQLEFLYDQLPNNMRSVAGAVFWCSSGAGHYAGTVILQLVHHITSAAGTDWLMDNMDQGHLDYFYFLLAILQAANLLLFLVVSNHYKYK